MTAAPSPISSRTSRADRSRLRGATTALDEREVGGKLARQRTLADHGLPVPRFFCLTAAFFDSASESIRARIAERLAAIDFTEAASIRAAAEDVRGFFESLVISPSQEREILASFDRHFTPTTLVAVRASTVGHRLDESEDSETNPFAGMSETFLFTRREDVVARIKACWASGFSQESLIYRHAQGMSLSGFGVSVAVQEMVFGTRSFVLFTCNPKTAARETVVVAGYGIGEGVVQEKVAVDHYFVSGTTSAVRREIVSKNDQLTIDTAAGHGLTRTAVDAPLRDRACLSDVELQDLATLGRKIEDIFGVPQDVEGTITADGKVHLLQARPIALDRRRMRVWTNANVTESFPGVTTALTYSFSRYFYRVIFRDCYRRLGVDAQSREDNHESLDRMIGFLGGRVYYNLTAFYQLHSQSPLFPIFRAHWEKMMGFRASYDAAVVSPWSRAVGAVKRGVAFAVAACVALFRYLTHFREMRAFHAWWEALIGPLRGNDLHGQDPLVVIGDFHRVWREVGTRWGVTLLNDTYLPLIYGIVEKAFHEDPRLAGDASLLSDLLCGDEELLSVEIILSSVRLAERVRASASLSALFAVETAEEIWRRLDAGELEPDFAAAVRDHLHRYGDRGLQELKMEQPNLRHDPPALVRIVQGYATSDTTVAALHARELASRAGGEARLSKALASAPLERAKLRWLLGTLRRLIRSRENSRYCRSELFGYSKNVFRALGLALATRGALRDAGDVVHLTQDEIFGWFDGTGVTENLQALADLRRKELATNETRETAMDITTLGPVRDNELTSRAAALASGSEASNELRGLGSSAGRVRGRACVVLDPMNAPKLGPDAILIARETDPGWLFLMLAAKGIVVERGSMLSHTAITGRKFGIPTIVSVPGATTRIANGELIEIDGASGVVTRIEE